SEDDPTNSETNPGRGPWPDPDYGAPRPLRPRIDRSTLHPDHSPPIVPIRSASTPPMMGIDHGSRITVCPCPHRQNRPRSFTLNVFTRSWHLGHTGQMTCNFRRG